MKRNLTRLILVGSISFLSILTLGGCGGGGSSGSSLPPANLTERNLALESKLQSSVDENRSNVKNVNDGISNQNNNYWTGFNKNDNFVMSFGDYKQINKLVIYTNDISNNISLPAKKISFASRLATNGTDPEWIDLYFVKPADTTETSTGTAAKPEYLACSTYEAKGNTITCTFDKPLFIVLARLRLTDNSPSAQRIYEFELWGHDAPR